MKVYLNFKIKFQKCISDLSDSNFSDVQLDLSSEHGRVESVGYRFSDPVGCLPLMQCLTDLCSVILRSMAQKFSMFKHTILHYNIAEALRPASRQGPENVIMLDPQEIEGTKLKIFPQAAARWYKSFGSIKLI